MGLPVLLSWMITVFVLKEIVVYSYGIYRCLRIHHTSAPVIVTVLGKVFFVIILIKQQRICSRMKGMDSVPTKC